MANEKTLTEQEKLKLLLSKGILTNEEYQTQLKKLEADKSHSSLFSFSTLTPEEKKKRILFIIVLTGVFSILAGLGLMIAANWAAIPASVKILGALAVLGLSLGAVFISDTHKRPFWKEVFLFTSFFLIAGNMAVIQQSFNFNLSWNEGSAIWFALSLPLIFMTKKKYLPICSTLLFVFGVWEYLVDIFNYLNYMLISGLFAVLVFLSFLLDGKTAKILRTVSFSIALLVLVLGDVDKSDIAGLISTIIFAIYLSRLPRTEDGQVRFCNAMFVLIAWRIFLLFCGAYHNLMSIGIQLVVFGTVLLAVAGLYYYFFERIQQGLRKWVHHE